MNEPVSSSFPVLDSDRATDTAEYGRVIVDYLGVAEPRVPEVDSWLAMPVRLVHDQAAGMHLEVGPYDWDRADIEVMRAAIAAYDDAVGRDA